ncbi:MAG: LysE family transporter [Anaerolineae bacterium]
MDLILAIGTFWVVSLSGALSPGPLSALAITEGARSGAWSGPKLALGHGLAEAALVGGIAYGLGAWLQRPMVAGGIGLVGGAILLWMGYGLTVNAWQGRLTLQTAREAPASQAVRLGAVPAAVLVSIGNPYWSLWWATFGASQIARVMPYGAGALALFYVLGHWTADLGWLSVLSLTTASGSRLIGERTYRAALLICGLFLLAFGGYFIWSGWHLVL